MVIGAIVGGDGEDGDEERGNEEGDEDVEVGGWRKVGAEAQARRVGRA